MLTLMEILGQWKLQPLDVRIMRHSPREPELQRHLAGMAVTQPELYNAYQSFQYDKKAEASLTEATHLISCVNYSDKALFVGTYVIEGFVELSAADFRARSDVQKLVNAYGMMPLGPERETIKFFDLRLLNLGSESKGKLVLEWPQGQTFYRKAWDRDAERSNTPQQAKLMRMSALREESALDPPVPDWRNWILPGGILAHLTPAMERALTGWSAIYLFSILERLSPDTPPDEVIARESSWKERLHTRGEWGLNDN